MNELLDVLSRASEGLFEITGIYSAYFDNGVYRCAIAKPTKRMRAALSADREILVVASNFADQQQRTVKLVKQEIAKSDGRFETSLAIVIHCDPDGNQKLRNWGRDLGVAVLPVYGRLGTLTPGDFEASLCQELYAHDPFDVTGPVSDDANFFGRRDEAMDLARKLQRGQIRSCLGIRKVGKTSIINRVVSDIGKDHDAFCLMIDCSRDSIWELGASLLLSSIAGSVEAGIAAGSKYGSIDPSLASDPDIGSGCSRLQRAVMACDKPVVLIFDEIDYITPGSPTRPAWEQDFNLFWRNLRAVYQEIAREHGTLSMLIGGVSTHWFTVESIAGIENAALAFVPEEYLSPLPERATAAMLRRLGKTAGLSLDDAAAVLIAQTTGNMPYWARKCASYIHRHIPISDRPRKVERADVESLVAAFVREEGASIAEVALRHLFRVHPKLTLVAEKCADGCAADAPEPLLRSLRRYGVTTARNEISGAMMKNALAALRQERAATVCETEAPAANSEFSLNEWAEEIAALGQRRNLLERRLRDMMVNFLRFDSLQSGRDPKERVLSGLPKQRRDQLAHMSVEDAASRMTWLELTGTIAKEWSLFERLLGDKRQFLSNADIINERYDAHAKIADAADVAQYRRALTQVEDRVARIQ